MKRKIYIITVTDGKGRQSVYESTMSWQCAIDILHNLAMAAQGGGRVKVYAYDLDWDNAELLGEGEIVACYSAPERPQDRIVAHVTMPQF